MVQPHICIFMEERKKNFFPSISIPKPIQQPLYLIFAYASLPFEWDLLCVNKVAVIASYSFLYGKIQSQFSFSHSIYIYLDLLSLCEYMYRTRFWRKKWYGNHLVKSEWKAMNKKKRKPLEEWG